MWRARQTENRKVVDLIGNELKRQVISILSEIRILEYIIVKYNFHMYVILIPPPTRPHSLKFSNTMYIAAYPSCHRYVYLICSSIIYQSKTITHVYMHWNKLDWHIAIRCTGLHLPAPISSTSRCLFLCPSNTVNHQIKRRTQFYYNITPWYM